MTLPLFPDVGFNYQRRSQQGRLVSRYSKYSDASGLQVAQCGASHHPILGYLNFTAAGSYVGQPSSEITFQESTITLSVTIKS